MRWPHVLAAVRRYIDDTGGRLFAQRVVLKAHRGEELYLNIVKRAWAQRNSRRRRIAK